MRRIYLFAVLVFACSVSSAQVQISFGELETLLDINSPNVKIIKSDYELKGKQKEIDLEWSNPEFEFELDNLKNGSDKEIEKVFSLHKEFEMPWVYSKKKDIWESKINSAALRKDYELNSFLAEMKTGYVELVLLTKQMEDVNEIKAMLGKITNTASLQHDEGVISGFEKNLIQMSLTNFDKAIIELVTRKKQLLSVWKTSAGIDKETQVIFSTPVNFKNIDTSLLTEISTGTENFLTVKAHNESINALHNEVDLEGMNFLPSINLGGGYKEVSNGLKGLVLGISLPVPLLNFNGAAKELKEIELDQFEYRFAQYKNTIVGEVNSLINSIELNKAALEKINSGESEMRKGLVQIEASYNEGWISLSDMLNAVSIYYDYTEAVNKQLVDYYAALFSLESLSGKSLVTF